MKIKLTGWNEGLKKVSLTKLQTKHLDLSLKEAKENVDLLLEGFEIEIVVTSEENAENFINEAKEIGVICKIEK